MNLLHPDSKNRVAILGAGPSAMYGKAAAEELGYAVDIFSDRIGNIPVGRIWYRIVPPSIQCLLKPAPVYYIALGDKKTYMARMNRPENSQSAFPIGSIQANYGYNPEEVKLCLMPENAPMHLVPQITDENIREIAEAYRWVFVTFATEESRLSQPPRIKYPVLIADQKLLTGHPNIYIYNGTTDTWWTRYTEMWGTTCWEFSHSEYPTLESVKAIPEVNQPGVHLEMSPEFSPGTLPWPEDRVPAKNVYLLGRWAKWDKACHTHDAYYDVRKILTQEEQRHG